MQTPGYPVAYVGNIGFDVHSSELRKLFEDCNVTKVRLHTDKDTGKSKGFAHIHFADDECLDRWVLSSRLVARDSAAMHSISWAFAGRCLTMALSLGAAGSRLDMLNPRNHNQKVVASGCQLEVPPCICTLRGQPEQAGDWRLPFDWQVISHSACVHAQSHELLQ